MASVYDFDDYKSFLKEWFATRPKGGRGEARRMALKLEVSTTLVSQVINGDKHFTMEAASDVCDFCSLSDRDADQFLLLVEYARAGHSRLRNRLMKRIEAGRQAARKLAERLKEDRHVTEVQAATFYSHWIYTGLVHITACQPKWSIEELAARLNLPPETLSKMINFLLESGIMAQENGAFAPGFKTIYLKPDSPHVIKHHQNWRLQAMQRMPINDENDFYFTAPMSLSEDVARKVRTELAAVIERIIVEWVGPSPSEEVRCLNIDWFKY